MSGVPTFRCWQCDHDHSRGRCLFLFRSSFHCWQCDHDHSRLDEAGGAEYLVSGDWTAIGICGWCYDGVACPGGHVMTL